MLGERLTNLESDIAAGKQASRQVGSRQEGVWGIYSVSRMI